MFVCGLRLAIVITDLVRENYLAGLETKVRLLICHNSCSFCVHAVNNCAQHCCSQLHASAHELCHTFETTVRLSRLNDDIYYLLAMEIHIQ